MALHDLAGKLTGRSLAELWGRRRGGPITLELDRDLRVAGRGRGGTGRRPGSAATATSTSRSAPTRRSTCSWPRSCGGWRPDGFLWADANGGYDVATALDVAPKLADVGVDVLEAPLRPNRISGYQALQRQGALPITMDEGLVSPVEVEEFIRLGMVDGITIKPSRAGGLDSARRQIELALDAGLFFLGSGLTDPDVALAASLALYSCYGLTKPAALNGPQFLPDDILVEPLPIRGDQAQVPSGPGLGITVDEAKVQTLLVHPSFGDLVASPRLNLGVTDAVA